LHFFLFQTAQALVLRGFGEETAAGIAWGLVVPWLRGILAAWLLAAWVCLFKRCDTGHPAAEKWIQF
jgi:preprotein translocase subunit SecF